MTDDLAEGVCSETDLAFRAVCAGNSGAAGGRHGFRTQPTVRKIVVDGHGFWRGDAASAVMRCCFLGAYVPCCVRLETLTVAVLQ